MSPRRPPRVLSEEDRQWLVAERSRLEERAWDRALEKAERRDRGWPARPTPPRSPGLPPLPPTRFRLTEPASESTTVRRRRPDLARESSNTGDTETTRRWRRPEPRATPRSRAVPGRSDGRPEPGKPPPRRIAPPPIPPAAQSSERTPRLTAVPAYGPVATPGAPTTAARPVTHLARPAGYGYPPPLASPGLAPPPWATTLAPYARPETALAPLPLALPRAPRPYWLLFVPALALAAAGYWQMRVEMRALTDELQRSRSQIAEVLLEQAEVRSRLDQTLRRQAEASSAPAAPPPSSFALETGPNLGVESGSRSRGPGAFTLRAPRRRAAMGARAAKRAPGRALGPPSTWKRFEPSNDDPLSGLPDREPPRSRGGRPRLEL